MRSDDPRGPFPDYAAPYWDDLDIATLADEQLVSKLHLLDNLEVSSPYRGTSVPVWRRIWRSLEWLDRAGPLPASWKHAALYLFANTVYLPQVLLNDAWRALYLDLCEGEFGLEHIAARQTVLSRCHFFENDPNAMTSVFCHVNGIEGRLDNQRQQRVDGVDKLADVLLDLLNPAKSDSARSMLATMVAKSHWVLLVDKSLSGHSVVSDLRRLILARGLAEQSGLSVPRIVVLCQVLTSRAEHSLRDLVAELRVDGISWHKAVYFDDRHSVTHPDTTLILDPSLRTSALELCQWFAEHFLIPDRRLDRMRDRSGDNLEYGYRGCGLTLVDHANCPTDSLPIFWYSSEPGAEIPYAGPYIRVHSRIGNQSAEPSSAKWTTIAERPEIIEALRR
ncbi:MULTISPECIES: phosphoribosyltransferase-like protein [Amycolatopsis]|uniref:PRTase-CE domain-containing protein n=3 Tax=Amycolatopsis TaxID=1813 RepID=A0ABW5HTQ2_9PSEU